MKQFQLSPARQRHTWRSSSIGKRKNIAWFFLLPSLVGTAIFIVIPFGDVLRRSFMEAYSGKFAGVENYKTVFTNEAFGLAMKNTMRFLLVCIPVLLAVSLLMSIIINKMRKSKRIFQAVFLIPMAVPAASVVLFWKLAFDYNGYLNGIVKMFSGEAVDWMHQATAFSVLVFCYIWKNLGYFIVLWLAGLNAIPKTYYEAATVDGAGGWKCFLYITIPQIIPTFFMVTILAFVNSFKVFREAYLISGDYPHESIYLMQHLFNNWFVNMDVQKMSAAAVVLAFGISIFIGVLLKIIREKEV